MTYYTERLDDIAHIQHTGCRDTNVSIHDASDAVIKCKPWDSNTAMISHTATLLNSESSRFQIFSKVTQASDQVDVEKILLDYEDRCSDETMERPTETLTEPSDMQLDHHLEERQRQDKLESRFLTVNSISSLKSFDLINMMKGWYVNIRQKREAAA